MSILIWIKLTNLQIDIDTLITTLNPERPEKDHDIYEREREIRRFMICKQFPSFDSYQSSVEINIVKLQIMIKALSVYWQMDFYGMSTQLILRLSVL